MLDIRLLRERPDFVKEGLEKVGADPALVDQTLAYDEERRRLETEVGNLRNQRNVGSKEIGKLQEGAERETRKAEMRALGDRIAEMEAELGRVDDAQRQLMLNIPNLPHPNT